MAADPLKAAKKPTLPLLLALPPATVPEPERPLIGDSGKYVSWAPVRMDHPQGVAAANLPSRGGRISEREARQNEDFHEGRVT